MRCAERVINVDVTELGQGACERFVIRFLLLVKTHVLHQQHASVRHRVARRLGLLTNDVRRELHRTAQQLPQVLRNGLQ